MKYIYLDLLEVIYYVMSLWNIKKKNKLYTYIEGYLIKEERLVKYID